jgi:photosynthetic reaction center cytochrome c subunit
MSFALRVSVVLAFVVTVLIVVTTFEHPPVDSVQAGYRGLAMVELYNPRTLAEEHAANVVPAPVPAAEPGSPPVTSVFKNVQVLGDLSVAEFTRLMVAMTQWVAPKQGCVYCHTEGNLADDAPYTKRVARRMIQMTREVNTKWKDHVATTGVTCFTCHRGQPVPARIWFTDPGPKSARGIAGSHAGQNTPASAVGLTSLPYDPFSPLLAKAGTIRVQSETALPAGNPHGIKQTEQTYGLMMHISEALGVNCTYCHNTRSFFSWDASTPKRATAYYGIQMARNLNADYLGPLQSTFPSNRLGPLGDGPKLNCATCHQGVRKPLFGANMLKDYPALASPSKP